MEFDSTFNSDFAIHSYGFKPIEDQRKVIHFCDGSQVETLESSTEGGASFDSLPPGGEVETKSGGLLGWVDWLGGMLAYGLGISTPKYEYIIQESQRLHRQSDSTEEKDIRCLHTNPDFKALEAKYIASHLTSSMEALTVGLSYVDQCRLAGWGPGDQPNQWFETLCEVAKCRDQCSFEIKFIVIVCRVCDIIPKSSSGVLPKPTIAVTKAGVYYLNQVVDDGGSDEITEKAARKRNKQYACLCSLLRAVGDVAPGREESESGRRPNQVVKGRQMASPAIGP